MPRPSRPWYRASTGWWMAWINCKQVKLIEGPGNSATKLAAWKQLDVLLAQVETIGPCSKTPTVTQVIGMFLDYAKPIYDQRSFDERKRILERFEADFGHRPADDDHCKPDELVSWLYRHKKWKSSATRAHIASVIVRVFNWAAKSRRIAANPFRGAEVPPDTARRRPMTDEEFLKLEAAATGEFQDFLRFLRLTGCRPGEASKLTWANIDLDLGVAYLATHKTTKLQREPKPRLIPLSDEAVALLRPREAKEGFVFRTNKGTRWNRSNLSLRMQRLRKKVKLPKDATLYGLRHAFGTKAVVAGVQIKVLSEILGHNSTRMTEHYIHLAKEVRHLKEAVNKVIR